MSNIGHMSPRHDIKENSKATFRLKNMFHNHVCKFLKVCRATYFLSTTAIGSSLHRVNDDEFTPLFPLVICGPSGSGKSSLLKKLFADYPDHFGFSVSHTTRKPRPGEKNGVAYHFTTVALMKESIAKGEFLETAMYSGHMYGTSREAVEAVKRKGKICALDIEAQGVKQLKKTDLNAVYIFVKAPSLKVLEERLRERGTETEESLKLRLKQAAKELEYGTKENFDHIVVNDVLEKAYQDMKEFLLRTYKLAK